jgi:hypothetical protein
MEMDAAADAIAAAATHPTAVECSVIDQVAQPSIQSTATAPTVLPRGKKEMTQEARAAESKERAARRLVAKQKEKDRKATDEKVRQAIHTRATAEALAKQAAVHGRGGDPVRRRPIWVHSQLCVVSGGVTTPSVVGPIVDAWATFPVGGPVAPRRSGGVHSGWWRVLARHRPQPHAYCGRNIVRAQQGSMSPRHR